MPESSHVVIDTPVPAGLPVWGSILDEVWALGVDGDTQPREWCEAAERQWEVRGIESNAKKAVNDQLGEEVQGLYLDPLDRTLALSVPKRALLMQALVRLLVHPRPFVAEARAGFFSLM